MNTTLPKVIARPIPVTDEEVREAMREAELVMHSDTLTPVSTVTEQLEREVRFFGRELSTALGDMQNSDPASYTALVRLLKRTKSARRMLSHA